MELPRPRRSIWHMSNKFLAPILVSWLLLSSCGPVDRSGPARDATALTARATKSEINGVLNFSSEVRAKPAVTVTSRIPGTVMQVAAVPGARVSAGDTLVELDRPALEVEVARANLALAGAQARLAALANTSQPDQAAEADAQLRATRARLASLEAAPSVDQRTELVRAVTSARQRVSELEHGQPTLLAELQTAVDIARDRVDRLIAVQRATPQPGLTSASPPPEVVAQAQQSLIDAQERLKQVQVPASGPELSRARQDLAQAEERLLLSRATLGPNDLEEARAMVEAAERRQQRLNQPVSDAEKHSAEAAVEQSWAALELARLQLREATILAPSPGVIADVLVAPGVPTAAGAPLVSLVPLDFDLQVPLSEILLGAVSVGQSVSLGVDAYPNDVFTGVIRSIAPVIDLRGRTAAMKIEVSDPQFKLKGGMFANVSIAAARRQATLLVPREAIVGRDPDAAVYVVVDGRARRQAVQTGLTDGRLTEVLSGLAEGTEVLLSPTGTRDGDTLTR